MPEAKKKPRVRTSKKSEERRSVPGQLLFSGARGRRIEKAKTEPRENGFSVSESKVGYLVWAPGREIIGSSESKDHAEMIVAALNGGDVTALRRWRRSPAGKKANWRIREEVDLRLAAA